MYLKLLLKKVLQKTVGAVCGLIGNKIADKIIEKFQEVHHIIVQRRLEVKQKIKHFIEKYQKKDIYLQKKDSELLIS